jgi:hypothetical protein
LPCQSVVGEFGSWARGRIQRLRLALDVFEGVYQLWVKGAMMSNSAKVSIVADSETRYQVSFGALGILGGGLKLEPI